MTEEFDRTHDGDRHCHARDVVAVIDNADVPLHRGRYDLETLKTLGKVPAADTLLQLVGTKLERVAADRPIEICGGEIFASHPAGGGAS